MALFYRSAVLTLALLAMGAGSVHAGAAAPSYGSENGAQDGRVIYDPYAPLVPAKTQAQAKRPPAGAGKADQSAWDITLGAGFAISPKYPGASAYHARPIPMVSVGYEDTIFLNQMGLGIEMIKNGPFKGGFIVGLETGRDESDDDRLRGLGDISLSANGGAYLSYTLDSWVFDVQAKHSLTHADYYGLSGDIGASYRMAFLDKTLLVSAGPRLAFADSDYMKTWFGVDRWQAMRSGLVQHDPDGGVKDVSVNAVARYFVTPHVVVTSFATLKSLVGDAADSPIVEDKTSVTAGMGLGYRF